MRKAAGFAILVAVLALVACKASAPAVEPKPLRLALLPMDGRSVTREMPVDIGATAGVEVVVPPVEILGYRRVAADLDAVREWLYAAVEGADALVVSLDMLGYGGLSPSRQSGLTYEGVVENLSAIVAVRNSYPRLPIYALLTNMRIPSHNTDAEEPDYWGTYGLDLWQYSYYTHQYAVTGYELAGLLAGEARSAVPDEYVQDFHARRERNFAVNMYALDLLEQGVLDFLVFPQDDTSLYGFNIAEQQVLSREIDARGLCDRTLMYPGADEVGSVLLARALNRLHGTAPGFFVLYGTVNGAQIVARYEDRPLQETVASQIAAAGGRMVQNIDDADIVLAVNTPGVAQGEVSIPAHSALVEEGRDVKSFVQQIDKHLREGRAVAVADVAYANGADVALVTEMGAVFYLFELAAYAGWNTAGNSIGAAVAHASMQHSAGRNVNPMAHVSFLLKRFCDDYLYQALIRAQVQQSYDTQSMTPAALQEVVRGAMERAIREFYEQHFATVGELWISAIYLPWNRTFEVGLDVGVGGR